MYMCMYVYMYVIQSLCSTVELCRHVEESGPTEEGIAEPRA